MTAPPLAYFGGKTMLAPRIAAGHPTAPERQEWADYQAGRTP